MAACERTVPMWATMAIVLLLGLPTASAVQASPIAAAGATTGLGSGPSGGRSLAAQGTTASPGARAEVPPPAPSPLGFGGPASQTLSESGRPLGTPEVSPSGSVAAAASQTNHWWDIYYYSEGSQGTSDYGGTFTARADTLGGASTGDQILILPLNVLLGTSQGSTWFQFDIDFGVPGLGGVWWAIWANPNPVGACGNDLSYVPYGIAQASPYTAGLPYVPGDTYHWDFYPASSPADTVIFLVTDQTTGHYWWDQWQVPSLTLLYDYGCFSPSSAVEGYTAATTVSLTSVPPFQFEEGCSTGCYAMGGGTAGALLGYSAIDGGVFPVQEDRAGSGEPQGVYESMGQIGATGDWRWSFFGGGGGTVLLTLLSSDYITAGGSVVDAATLLGVTAGAAGTVTYSYYTSPSCSGAATVSGPPSSVAAGVVPASAPVQFVTAGSYGWRAVYSGDSANPAATSACEGLTVASSLSPPAIAASPAAVGYGGSSSLSTAASFGGGTAPYQCAWLESPPGSGSYAPLGTAFSCAPGDLPATGTGPLNASGTWSFMLAVSDGSAQTLRSYSNTATVSVSSRSPTTTAVTCDHTTVQEGGTARCVASVSGSSPSGQVLWHSPIAVGVSWDGPDYYCALLGGSCTFNLTSTTAGYVYLDAIYQGDRANQPSTGAVVINFGVPVSVACKPLKVIVGVAMTCRTAGAPLPGTVAWSSNSSGWFSKTSCPAKRPCIAVFHPTGASPSTVITAAYSGDPAVQPFLTSVAVRVAQRSSAVAIACTRSVVLAGVTSKCTATVTGYFPTGNVTWAQVKGTGAVTFSSPSCALSARRCSVTVTGTTAGSITIQASYGGDPNNAPAVRTRALRVR